MMRLHTLASFVIALAMPALSFAQIGGIGLVNGNQPAGVYVDADGTIHSRQTSDAASDLPAQRLRAKAAASAPKPGAITYVSLSKLFAQVQAAVDQKKEIPTDVRYLSGLTQIRYVFVYADDHDIVIAGPSEPFDATDKTEPTGKITGRPVMHLDDLVTALRCAAGPAPRPFGCSIDPAPDSMNKCNQVMKDLAGATRGARMTAMKEAIGLQKVSMFGAPINSRLMFVTVAADYKLKRMCLGLEPIPVPGVGLPVDNTRAASNRFWFEADYAPLLVSPDADAYELRGPRLVLKAGAFSFDTKGGTETAKNFAKNFSAKMPQLAALVPLYAELQNVSDMSVVATLIRKDNLAAKTGLNFSWFLSEGNYKPAPYATPLTAETMVNFTSGSIVAGGVSLDPARIVEDTSREQDKKETLKPARQRPASDNWFSTITPDEPKAKAR